MGIDIVEAVPHCGKHPILTNLNVIKKYFTVKYY